MDALTGQTRNRHQSILTIKPLRLLRDSAGLASALDHAIGAWRFEDGSAGTGQFAVIQAGASAPGYTVVTALRTAQSLTMVMKDLSQPTRRQFLVHTSMVAAGLEFSGTDAVLAQELAPTPACNDGDEPTVRQTEGPFFKPKSPERGDLREQGSGGRLFELSGFVLTRRCRPLRGAVVDLWHADDSGEYDSVGFRYRGHVITGLDGAFRFRTIVPKIYSGRTRHYHVKVQAPGSRLLTTQLYFPNEPANLRDGLFQRQLLMRVADIADGFAGRFDFVLDIR